MSLVLAISQIRLVPVRTVNGRGRILQPDEDSTLKLFITLCFLFSFQANGLCFGALTSNLQGYWGFEGNGQDSSGNGRDLNVVGAPGFQAGLIGQSLALMGQTSQFAIGQSNEPVFDVGADDFSLQVWVKFNTLSGEQTLFEKFTGGAGPGYTLTKLSNNNILFFAEGVGAINSTSSVLAADNWNHVVLRRNGSLFELFLNGSDAGELMSTNAVSASPNSILIGERDGGQSFPVRGDLDEVAFWNRSLTNTEIGTLFNDGFGVSVTAVPEPTSLVVFGLIAAIGGARRWRKHP